MFRFKNKEISAFEKNKDKARDWWTEISKLYYALSENDEEDNYKIVDGSVEVDRRIEMEASIRQASDENKDKQLYFHYIVVCAAFVALISWQLIEKQLLNMVIIAVLMIPAYGIIRILEKRYRVGPKKFYEDKENNIKRIDKAISLFAKAKGCKEDYVIAFLLGGFEKKRHYFFSNLNGEHIAAILFSALFIPGVSQLLDQQLANTTDSISSISHTTAGVYFIINNMYPLLGIYAFMAVYWVITFVIAVILQLPVSIIGNEMTKIFTTDALFCFYKECKLNSLINEDNSNIHES